MSDVHCIKPGEANEYGGYVLRGPSGPEKTALLLQRCRYLLENAAAGEGMLILVPNRRRLLEWDRELRHVYSVEPRLCTFRGFVRQELEVFYPLAAKRGGLSRTVVRPVFMDRNAAVNLIAKVVQSRREKDGSFASLSSTSEKIASDILGSLEAAAMAGIPYDQAFERLYSSLEIKNEDRRKIYRDAGEIARAYRNKCLALGVLDTAASIELYCGSLLKDESYRALLKKNIRYLAADDLQDWDEAQLAAAELLLPGLKGFVFGFDAEAACGPADRLRRNRLIEGRLLARCDAAEIGATYEAVAEDFSGRLYDAIISGKTAREGKGPAEERHLVVERHPAVELRSEMLGLLGERVCELIEAEGVRPSDIAILSTYADIVTELVLAGILQGRGYGLVNPSASAKASGSRLCRAMLAFAGLSRPHLKIYPSGDDVRLLMETLFSLDPPGASELAGKVCGSIPYMALPEPDWPGLNGILDEGRLKKYRYVTAWIENCKKSPEPDLDVFMQRALLEIFLELAADEAEINKGKLLIDRAGSFCAVVSRFGRNAVRDFLASAGYGTDVAAAVRYAAESFGEENVVLATPAVYLEHGLKRKVTVICGLSSSNWSPVRARELVNPNVLCAAWKPDEIYTAAHGESDRRRYLADIMRAVVRNCGERLITFESLLSASGYENNGILPEIFDAIL